MTPILYAQASLAALSHAHAHAIHVSSHSCLKQESRGSLYGPILSRLESARDVPGIVTMTLNRTIYSYTSPSCDVELF